MRVSRFTLLGALPAGLVIGLACQELASPPADQAFVPSFVSTPPDPILPVQLRGLAPPDPILPVSRAYGPAQLSFIPPDPIVPVACVVTQPSTVAGMTAAAICGQIHNRDAQTFTSGMIFQGPVSEPSSSIGIGGFSVDFPTSACPRVTLRGTLLLPDAFATALRSNPGSFALAFRSQEFPLASVVGAFGRGPAGPVTPPDPFKPDGPPTTCTVNLSTS